MSSGNPFRASIPHFPAASSPVPQTSFITSDSSVPEASEEGRAGLDVAPPPKTKKHVRIESNTIFIPPHPGGDHADDSPLSPVAQRLGQSEFINPSPSAPFANPSPTDVFAGQQETLTPVRGTEMATPDVWTGQSRGYQVPQSATSPSGIPANPFSRTLASIEPQDRDTEENRTPAERPALGNNRASLDVESFKNLLLTGKTGPRPQGRSPHTATAQLSVPSGSQFESSSSTDTSSISRQSLLENPHPTHPESPRTSLDMAESDEDESMGLVSEVKKGKKKPPPAPKHRHGKLVTARQPQTVSFDSFSASEPAPSPITRPRDNSDVNKPLPPTPVVSSPPSHISTQDTSQRQTPVQQYPSESLSASETPRPQKKTPPPVPLARRQSQLRTSTAGNRSRSNSSLTMSSQHSVEVSLPSLPSPAPSIKESLSVAKSPPPPPRSRHGARLTDISTSSANSSSTELPQRSTSVRTGNSMSTALSSRRSTIDSEPGSPVGDGRRTSSISSNRNSQRIVSNESTGSAMPPPPPPPRRRQSNRSSLDLQRPNIPSSPTESRRTSVEHRRTSTEYRRTSLENNRRTSVASESSLRREYAPVDDKGASEYALYSPNEESEKKLGAGDVLAETRSDSTNILDDMEKFQREIEELRLRYNKAD